MNIANLNKKKQQKTIIYPNTQYIIPKKNRGSIFDQFGIRWNTKLQVSQ